MIPSAKDRTSLRVPTGPTTPSPRTAIRKDIEDMVKRYRSTTEREKEFHRNGANAPASNTLERSYESDEGIRLRRNWYFEFTEKELQAISAELWYIEERISTSPRHLDSEPCFLLYQQNGRSALVDPIANLRTKIALEIGETPAKFQDFLPQYDEDFLRRYRYSYYVECRRHARNCVRPSHLTIQKLIGGEVRYPLTYSGRLSKPIYIPDTTIPQIIYRPSGDNLGKVKDAIVRNKKELRESNTRLDKITHWLEIAPTDPVRKSFLLHHRGDLEQEVKGLKEYISNLEEYIQLHNEYRENPTESGLALLLQHMNVPGKDFVRGPRNLL